MDLTPTSSKAAAPEGFFSGSDTAMESGWATGAKEEQKQNDSDLFATSGQLSHSLSPTDPDNPVNWPLYSRIYACAVAWAAGYAVAFGLSTYTAGIPEIIVNFHVSHITAVLGLSVYLWGIAFAPIWTPHISERFGRSIFYLTSLPLCGLFILGAGASNDFASLLVCRFFAGFFGGPCLVLIEGTFADVWSACTTNTYYAFLGTSAYWGAASGPLIGGYVLARRDWRWTQWVPLMVILAAILFAIGIPETYNREIERRRAKREGHALNQSPALSGVSIGQMLRVTVLDPLMMLVSEPIVILCSLFLGLHFGVVFQWFIIVPIVLEGVYKATLQEVGLAFIGAIVGASVAALFSICVEQFMSWHYQRKSGNRGLPIEYRLIPAIYGAIGTTASLFWIGWTASPAFNWRMPVLGTLVYVWGNVSIIISVIPYLFDAYPPAGTLSALTAAACFRITMAGLVPVVIIQMVTKLSGAWAYSTFGFISAAFIPIPVVLFKYGAGMRAKSRYASHNATMAR